MPDTAARGVVSADGAIPARHILWIDDDLAVIDYATAFLPTHGFRVDVAPDGGGGLGLARRRAYDAIVLDLKLPGPSGIEVLSDLRREGIRTPVIVLTAFPESDTALEAGKLGVSAYHTKPLVGSALVVALRAVAQGQPTKATPPLDAQTCLGDSGAELLKEIDELVRRVPLVSTGSGEDIEDRVGVALARRLCQPDLALLDFVAIARALRAVTTKLRPLTIIGAELGSALERAHARSQEPVDIKAQHILTRLHEAGAKSKPVRADSLAAEMEIEPGTLWRLLQVQMRMSLHQCRLTFVMHQAIQLLASTDEQVAQIAYQLGYEHPNQFDRDFRRFINVTPTRYRRMVREDRSRPRRDPLNEVFRKV